MACGAEWLLPGRWLPRECFQLVLYTCLLCSKLSWSLKYTSQLWSKLRRAWRSGAEAWPLQYLDIGANANIIALVQGLLRPASERRPLARAMKPAPTAIHLSSYATPAHEPVFVQFTVRTPAAWKRVQRTVTRHPSRIRQVS
ncbi:hypothetical protein K438DRAFT_1945468 [Mycena galopus ATCC 62051]|nr:hypothetical protein K438DRAFT_1945468 [Mycena galopus ATCC 62051]